MWFHAITPAFTESEIEWLENLATNPAELFIIRRFLEDHARRSVKETRESLCQSGDTEFLESNLTRICSGLMKHVNLPGEDPNVELLVMHLSQFIRMKAEQSVKAPLGGHGFHQNHFFPQMFPGKPGKHRDL